MARCPSCKELIGSLRYCCQRTEYGDYSAHGDYYDSDYGDGDCYEWSCPECGDILFQNSDDADEFLSKRLIFESEVKE
jgi:hypothetical protein